jgi:hypothetical protein
MAIITTDYPAANTLTKDALLTIFQNISSYIDQQDALGSNSATAALNGLSSTLQASIAGLELSTAANLAASELNAATNLTNAQTAATAVTDALSVSVTALEALTSTSNSDLNDWQEIVNFITATRTQLETILVNDLVTGGVTKALSAEQGKILKGLIDALAARVTIAESNVVNLDAGVIDLNAKITSIATQTGVMFPLI